MHATTNLKSFFNSTMTSFPTKDLKNEQNSCTLKEITDKQLRHTTLQLTGMMPKLLSTVKPRPNIDRTTPISALRMPKGRSMCFAEKWRNTSHQWRHNGTHTPLMEGKDYCYREILFYFNFIGLSQLLLVKISQSQPLILASVKDFRYILEISPRHTNCMYNIDNRLSLILSPCSGENIVLGSCGFQGDVLTLNKVINAQMKV